MRSETLLAAQNLVKSFATTAGELTVLDGLNFEVQRGQMVAIVGPSGIGKSTLLYLLAGLDRPTRGEIFYKGRRYSELTQEELATHRNAHIGFVWQLSNLLLDFTARENVALPLQVRGVSRDQAYKAADDWLAEVGLGDRRHHLAGELSGGEQQRAGLARALVGAPQVLFADEPTGNLDAATSEQIFTLLAGLHRTHGLTSVVATHNLAVAGRCDRVWRLERSSLAPAADPTT